MTLLTAIAEGDREALAGMLADGVVFHSPATTYEGRDQVLDLLALASGVLRGLSARREPQAIGGGETLTLVEASVEGEHLDGVLIERADQDGRIAEVTMLLRPLGTVQTVVRHVARALAERGEAEG